MVKIEYIGKCLLVEEEGKKMLAIGDLHLGYEESLNNAGVFVARQLFKEMLMYFDKLFKKVGRVEYIVLLGDVKHVFGNILRQEREDLNRLVTYLEEKCDQIVFIRGNHDVVLDPMLQGRKRHVCDYFRLGSVCFLHGNRDFSEIHEKSIGYWIVGHGHPAIALQDGVKYEKYKCFLEGRYKGKCVVIVPSFIEHTEGSDPREHDLGMAWNFALKKFKVWIVGEELEVLEFGTLGKL